MIKRSIIPLCLRSCSNSIKSIFSLCPHRHRRSYLLINSHTQTHTKDFDHSKCKYVKFYFRLFQLVAVIICCRYYWSLRLFVLDDFDLHIFIWKLCRHTKKDRPANVSISYNIQLFLSSVNKNSNGILGRQRELLSLSWKDVCLHSTPLNACHSASATSVSATLCFTIVISNMLGFSNYYYHFSVGLNNLLSNDMNIGSSTSGPKVFNWRCDVGGEERKRYYSHKCPAVSLLLWVPFVLLFFFLLLFANCAFVILSASIQFIYICLKCHARKFEI